MGVTGFLACVYFLGTASNVTHHSAPVVHFQRVEVGGIIQDFVNQLIKTLSVYDPIHVEEYYGNYFEYTFGVEKLHIEGFSDIHFNLSIDADIETKIRTSLSARRITASVKSWANTFPHIYGNGSARIDINNTFASLDVNYNLFTGFSPSKFISSIESADAYISGVLFDAVVSGRITECLNDYLNNDFNSLEFQMSVQSLIDSFLGSLFKETIEKRR